MGNHAARKALFAKDDWNKLPHKERREKFLEHFQSIINREHPWKNGMKERPDVIAMLQGTNEAAVWNICQNGFAKLGTLDDGFYGKGNHLHFSTLKANKN